MARPVRRTGNLPAETSSFIGRKDELAELRQRVTEARLVSVVGPGGVGKTRFALHAATDLARRFGAGAWLVQLGDVRDGELVVDVALSALDLRDQAAGDPLALLQTHVRDKELLLVVDNCEHLLDASALLVNAVLTAAPAVRVIATTREPLGLNGEHVLPLTPLPLPAPDQDASLGDLQHNDTVTLFVARAAAASGDFRLTAGNATPVVEICRRLDGLPLAIELAAVTTRLLTVEQIRDRLEDRFALLTTGPRAALPRHQTLRTAIEWSYNLLSDDERSLLRSLAVFAGQVTLDDVEAVCMRPDEISQGLLRRLGSLVDKSLVIKEDDGDVATYRLHESMREFASIESRAVGESDDLARRCVDHYLSRATAGPAARYRLVTWLAWAEREIDNVRAVLRLCVERDEFEHGLTLAVSFGWYWITRATSEGIRWFDEFIARTTTPSPVLPWAYFLRGFLAVLKAEPAAARGPLAKAIDLSRTGAIGGLLPQALAMAAVAEDTARDHSAASCYLDEAAAAAEGSGHRGAALAVLQARALHGFFTGDIDSARRSAAEGAQVAEAVGDVHGLQVMLLNLGTVALLHNHPDEAEPLLRDALRLAEQLDDRVTQAYLLDAFGCCAAAGSDAGRAAQLFGAADAARKAAAARVMPFLEVLVDKATTTTGAQLGPRYESAYELGRRLSRRAAIAFALGDTEADGAAVPPDEHQHASVLAPREMDVARLVAEGLTNKEIGSRLFISERTVDAHVRNILTKLGFSSRAQVAAWVATT